MSWVRPAVPLVGFGFTIVKFFGRIQDMRSGAKWQLPASQGLLKLAHDELPWGDEWLACFGYAIGRQRLRKR